MTSYKSALARPLSAAFVKALYNIQPNRPMVPVRWSLDRVLSFVISDRFHVAPSLSDLSMATVFLLALALGARSSELAALLRLDDNIVFSGDGVTLYPNPNILAKNERPSNRRDPIFISALLNEDGSHSRLCPVAMLRRYLEATSSTRSEQLFVDPGRLVGLSVHKIRLSMCRLVKLADPGSFPRSHDLRKMASSLAFFRTMSMEEICAVTGWSSIRVFRRHYLQRLSEVAPSVVVLGRPT